MIRRFSTTLSIPIVVAIAGCSSSSPETDYGPLPEGEWLDGASPQAVLESDLCAAPAPGASPLRRLSNAEYRNTLVELGLDPETVQTVTAKLPNEPESLGFRNGAETLSVNTLLAQQYQSIAQALAAEFAAPCSDADSDQACAKDFISELGLKTHRRPLTDEEKAAYLALYEQSRELDPVPRALEWVAEAMLQSPHFLYRVEIPDTTAVLPVTGYEMATRLAYTFWQSPPDAELLAAAKNGELETKKQVLAQARRLLRDERATRVYEFFEQWLDLDELDEIDRDPKLYPDLSPRLAQLLRAESRAFIEGLLRRGDATFEELLTAEYTYANAELAEHYGLEPVEGNAFVRVDAPGRFGILTQGTLAAHDGPTRSSIVRRGLKIRTDYLCQTVPAPPANVDLTLDGIGADLTQAERLEQHRKEPACATCHALIDPIGSTFEGFDAVGRQRDADEYGSPVEISGTLIQTRDLDGELSGIDDLAHGLAASAEAEQCYLMQNFRFFFGREATRADLCSQAQLTKHFENSDQNLVELLLGLTQTDAFLYKAPAGTDEGGDQ